MLTGVVEVGLFCHMARAAYFGNEVRISLLVYWLFSDNRAQQDESVTVRWNDGKVEQVARVPDTPAHELNAMHLNGNGHGSLNGSAIVEED